MFKKLGLSKKGSRSNKHFMIFYKRGTGTYVVTEPKPWARENQKYFPQFDFSSSEQEPRTEEINSFLIENYGFERNNFEESNVVVHYNMNPNLVL